MASPDGDVEMESPKAEKKEQPPPSEETAAPATDEKSAAPAKGEKSAEEKKDAPKPSEIPRLATSELTIDEIPIGRGGYGYVYRATHEAFGTVAIKTMISDGILPMRHQRVFQAEGKKLWQLCHSNIVQLLALIMEEGNYSLVLEYMHLGSLTAFLTDFPSTAPCLRVCILRDIAAGMAYLHTLNPPILHLDLKSDNILINRFIRAKITDFGLAQWKTMTRTMTGRQLASAAGARAGAGGAGGTGAPAGAEGDTDTVTGRRGTVTHVPPEVWSNVNTPPNMAYDVYGFGIVIWETMTGDKPFGVVKEDIVPKAVLSGQRPDVTAIPKACPKTITSLMKNCWEQQANKRPKFPGILSDIEACFRSIAAQVRKALGELETEIQTLYTPEDLGGDTHFAEQSESLLDLAEVTIPKKLADIDRKLEEKKKAEEAAKAAKLAAAAAASSSTASSSSSTSSSAQPATSSASAASESTPKAKTTLELIREDPDYRAKVLRQVLRDPVQLFIMEQDPSLLKNAFQIDDSIHTFLRDPDEMKKVFEEDPHLKYEMMRRGFDYLGWLYTPQGCRSGFRKKFPKRMSKPHLIEDQAKKIRDQEEAERKREEESTRRQQEYMREGRARRVTVDSVSEMLHMPRQQILRQISGLLENPTAFQRFMSRRPYPGSVDPRLEEILQDPEAMLSVLQSEPRLMELARKEDPDIMQTLYRASTRRGPKSRMMHPMMLEREMRGIDLDEDDMDMMMMGPSSLRAQMMMMEHPMMRTMREMSDPMGPMSMNRMRGPSGRYMEEMYGDSMEEGLPGKPPQKKAFMSRLKDKMIRSLSHKEEEPPGMRPAPEHIQVVQEDIGADWKKLAEKLGMSPKFSERLEEETHNFPDENARIKEMLTTWSRWSNATFENLAKALRQINRHDVANKMVSHKVKPLPWNSTTASATSTTSTATTSTASSSSSSTSSSAAKDSKTGSSVDAPKK